MASPCPLTRAQVIDVFRQRLRTGAQPLLTRAEQAALAAYLRDRLMAMAMQDSDTPNAIRALCEAEKVTLEAGFSRGQIQTYFLPEYTRVLEAAIATGQLPLTAQNSYPQLRSHADGSVSRVDRRHHAFDFLTYGSLVSKASTPDQPALPVADRSSSVPQGAAPEAEAPSPPPPEPARPVPKLTEVVEVPMAIAPAPAPPLAPAPSPLENSSVAPPTPDIQHYLEELLAAHRHQAETLTWATQRLATLEAENTALKATQADASRIPVLEAQLAAAHRKLHQIQALFDAVPGEPTPEVSSTVAVPSPEPEDAPSPTVPPAAAIAPATVPPAGVASPAPTMAPPQSDPLVVEPTAVTPAASPAPKKTRRRSAAPGTQRRQAAQSTAAAIANPAAEPAAKGAAKAATKAASKPATKGAKTATKSTKSTSPTRGRSTQTAAPRTKTTPRGSRSAPAAAVKSPQGKAAIRTGTPTGRKGGRALDRAARIFQGIEQWNRQHPEEAFAITASFLETKFNINRGAAQSFCEAQQSAIQKMHDRIGLEPGRAKYFNRGKNIDEMVQFVEAQITP